eukprot:SAG31_NODE_6121_length_2159_cov_7.060673_1_plen_158_part_00
MPCTSGTPSSLCEIGRPAIKVPGSARPKSSTQLPLTMIGEPAVPLPASLVRFSAPSRRPPSWSPQTNRVSPGTIWLQSMLLADAHAVLQLVPSRLGGAPGPLVETAGRKNHARPSGAAATIDGSSASTSSRWTQHTRSMWEGTPHAALTSARRHRQI